MAIRSFDDQTTSDIYHGENTKAARKIGSKVWPHAQRRLSLLHAAKTPLDLASVPGLHFKPLKHDRPGFYSVRVNDQYRVTFNWKDDAAEEVWCGDYH